MNVIINKVKKYKEKLQWEFAQFRLKNYVNRIKR